MSQVADNIIKQLTRYGLTRDEAAVYTQLIQLGKSTALKLHRMSGMPRTKVYRLLEKLVKKSFANEVIEGYGKKYIATNYDYLNQVLFEKEQYVDTLKKETPVLLEKLSQLHMQAQGDTKIVHYRGVGGLKQVTYNTLDLQGDFRIYEIELMHAFLDMKFSEEMRLRYGQMDSKFFQLTNLTEFKDYTNITEHIQQWEIKHLSKEDIEITVETQIYNDVVALIDYKSDDVFIVEIYNQKLADMQKQLFDFIWKHAVPMEKTSNFGAARVSMNPASSASL